MWAFLPQSYLAAQNGKGTSGRLSLSEVLCVVFGQCAGSAYLGIALSVLGNIFLWME